MKLIIIFINLALVLAKPNYEVKYADNLFYTANNTCYFAEHEIVDVHLPVAFIEENKIFMIQKDIPSGMYKGAYVLHITMPGNYNDVTAQKILENGKCITSDEKRVYFGATDGIYTYNYSTSTVEKYGSITANIKDIEKYREKDLIYIVTEDNKLYLVTEKGNVMVEHETIRNVHEIAMDDKNNLYFYETHEDGEKHRQAYKKDNRPKVLVENSVVTILGLPCRYNEIKLISARQDKYTLVIVDNNMYKIYSDGTSRQERDAFLDTPTASSVEAGLIQIYGVHRKLYCFVVDLRPLSNTWPMPLH